MKRVRWSVLLIAIGVLVAFDATALAGRRANRRAGCTDPCVTCQTAVSPQVQTAARTSVECMTPAWTELQVVLVPTYVTETRSMCSTTYRDEERSRVVSGYKTITIDEERIRLTTVSTPHTESKMIEYKNQVAVQSEQQKSYKIKTPVWEDREETYMVKVPVLSEVEETYTVKVPVLRDVQFTYTVNAPYPVTRTGTRTVSNVVPVVKTQNVEFCVPTTRTTNNSVDRGHWENQVVENSAGMGRRAAPTTQRVWVPNVVHEESSQVESQQKTAQVEYLVYEQHYNTVPYECVCIEYRPETRTGTKQEVVYQDETRTRMRTVVNYRDEPRTRMTKVISFKEEERTESFPVVTYQPEAMSKEVSFTVYVPETKAERYTVSRQIQVPDHRIETYMVRVAVPQVRETQVQVTRMVPKVVSVTVNPCGGPNRTEQQPNVAIVPASYSYETAAVQKCCGDK